MSDKRGRCTPSILCIVHLLQLVTDLHKRGLLSPLEPTQGLHSTLVRSQCQPAAEGHRVCKPSVIAHVFSIHALQLPIHHKRVDVAARRMCKRSWQSTDDFKAQALPELDCPVV